MDNCKNREIDLIKNDFLLRNHNTIVNIGFFMMGTCIVLGIVAVILGALKGLIN